MGVDVDADSLPTTKAMSGLVAVERYISWPRILLYIVASVMPTDSGSSFVCESQGVLLGFDSR